MSRFSSEAHFFLPSMACFEMPGDLMSVKVMCSNKDKNQGVLSNARQHPVIVL